ncbi:MAG TPA: outer membrane lipoprotein carrier protein LolA [Agriterribacter sp.]|nr:outer membrane lipoprotein carrier protein LolA [Agriterribacter sp.]
MHKVIVTAILCLATMIAAAQYPGYTLLADDAGFLSRFAATSQKTNTIKSDFVQEKNLSLLADKIVSKGKFWFKKENMVRMEYTSPFQYLMIINGSDLYVKDNQVENKISAKSNKLFQQINRVIVECVQGKALQGSDFTTRVFEGSSSFLAELTPINKNMKSLFKSINLIINKKDDAVSKIEMYEPSGDYTIISFINRELNTTLSDALFTIR